MKRLGFAVASLALFLPLVLPLAAHAEDRIVLDYQNRQFRSAEPAVAGAERARVATALPSVSNAAVTALGKDFVLLGKATGKANGQDVDFFLAASKRTAAADPSPQGAGQVIVAMKGKDIVATHALPADRRYARLVGAVDLDGDNASELLLEGSGFNMGQLIVSVDAVKLDAGGKARVAQHVDEAFADTCDNPVGKKSRTAKTIMLKGGKLVDTVHTETCG